MNNLTQEFDFALFPENKYTDHNTKLQEFVLIGKENIWKTMYHLFTLKSVSIWQVKYVQLGQKNTLNGRLIVNKYFI